MDGEIEQFGNPLHIGNRQNRVTASEHIPSRGISNVLL
jgi:hypothetical protein